MALSSPSLPSLINNPRLSLTYLFLSRMEYVGWIDDSHSGEIPTICILAEHYENGRLKKEVEELLSRKLSLGMYQEYVVFSDRPEDMKYIGFRIVR